MVKIITDGVYGYNEIMQILASSLIGANVLSIHSGQNLGKISGWLVSTKDLKIELLVVSANDKKTLYLMANDIRSLGNGAKSMIIIDSSDKLSEKEDLLRHQDLIGSKFDLMGLRVATQSGKKIGKVKDLSIDFQDLYILKLHIKAKVLQRITNERLLVDRTDIVEIKKDRIIIKDSYAKTKQSYAKVLPA